MEIRKEIIVNRGVSETWEVLGNQFGDAYKWATGLYHSEGFGTPQLAGATFNNRKCNTSFGTITEEIRAFDTNEHHLSYEVIDGFPGFVKKGVNNWRLQRINEKQTKVLIHFVGETQGILGVLMGGMMKIQLNKALTEALVDFKNFVETGNPSPGKIKDNKKNQNKIKTAA